MKNAFEYEDELAALREELATMTQSRDYCNRVALHNKELGDSLQQSLTAAEQRNATLVKAATEFMEYAESGWDFFPEVGFVLRAALKTNESAASE